MKENHKPILYIFFLGFEAQHTMSGLERLESLLNGPLSSFDPIVKIVDNSENGEEIFKDWKYEVITGDNTFFDFSGWDKAWRGFKTTRSIGDNNWVLFVNDSFHRNYGDDYLKYLTSDLVKSSINENTSIGYLDDFPKEAELCGIRYKHWIRSNFILMPSQIAMKLDDLLFPYRGSFVISDNEKKFWSDSDLISSNFKAYISSWLFGEVNPKYPEYRLKWYKAEKLTAGNKDFFYRKAIAILSEHYLGARFFNFGFKINNLNQVLLNDDDRHTIDYYEQQFRHK